MSILTELKNISADDRKMIADTEAMIGPEPSEMGLIKNMFWGRLRNDLAFPYPRETEDHQVSADRLLETLTEYLENEHPSVSIDQNEEVPRWVIDRLFEMGVMRMIIPEEYGGLGLGVTSYNRILEKIGSHCASTAVIVSAHQSIGCKALVLFGSDKQKAEWLPKAANEFLSAFCLSEPNVGCDAAGQETECHLSADGTHYILNGEKKWITSGSLSGLLTVIAKQTYVYPQSGEKRQGFTALICNPNLPGIDIYQNNRSKCGIRGTWQARIRFTDVKVPVENRLSDEGKGLKIALACLNYGRCTLSAGMLGSAVVAAEQAIKWSRTRYQFGRPLSDFELVKSRIANMTALTYAMDATLYMTTGMLDRRDADIMVETAATKVFCSEMGWRVVNDAVQIMGGESYMTENEVERAFRDSRINLIVEGANEVMQSFIFAYGGKQLAEQLLGLTDKFLWDSDKSFGANVGGFLSALARPKLVGLGTRTGAELLLGLKRPVPAIPEVHQSLRPMAERLARIIRDQSFVFKKASMKFKEEIVTRQSIQARIADNFIYLFGMVSTLAKLDEQVRSGDRGISVENDKAAAAHYFDLAEVAIEQNTRAISRNADTSMLASAEAAIAYNDTLPNSLFIVAEKSPTAAGTGRTPDQTGIKQFPGQSTIEEELESVLAGSK
ncbi:MAG: acyl-CoA dehydrogenase family protein [Rhodothermia bacterium]